MDENNTIIIQDSEPKKNRALLFIGLILAVAIIVIAVHWPVLSTKTLCFDDHQYLINNIPVQNPSWSSAKRFLIEVFEPSTVDGYYQPLTMIWLMLDYSLAGDVNNFKPFHYTSLTVHVANTILVVALIYTIFGNIWVAAICGLLFGLHPMTVETIGIISEKKTLLASFFAFWSLLFYINYANKKRLSYYIFSILTFLLALMAKPTPIALPLLFILLDWWPLGRLNLKTLQEKMPFFVIVALSAVITLISQSTASPTTIGGGYGVKKIWLVLCHNIIFYPLKMLCPVNMSAFYPFPEPFDLTNPFLKASVIGTLILLPVLVLSARWNRAPLTGWLFFFVGILPTMQIVRFSNVIASDKFAYLPAFGFLMLLAFGLNWLWDKNRILLKAGIITAAVLAATGEAIATRSYLVHWKNTKSFCQYMLTKTPGNLGLHYMLGNALREEGKFHEAYEHYQIALTKEPDSPWHHNNYGILLAQLGNLDEALIHFEKAVTLKPDFAEAHFNLAKGLSLQGNTEAAIMEYQKVLEYRNDYIHAYNDLGLIYMEQKKFDEAIEYFSRAIHYSPNYALAHNNLGLVLMKQGRIDEAIAHFQKALEIIPDYPQAISNLNKALQLKNNESQEYRESQ